MAIVAVVSVFSLPEDGLAAQERFRFPFEFPPKSKVCAWEHRCHVSSDKYDTSQNLESLEEVSTLSLSHVRLVLALYFVSSDKEVSSSVIIADASSSIPSIDLISSMNADSLFRLGNLAFTIKSKLNA